MSEQEWRPSRADGESLLRLITELRDAYRPRPTAWSDMGEEEARRLTARWAIALGKVPPEFVAEAIDLWRHSPSGAFFPSLNDLDESAHRLWGSSMAGSRMEELRQLTSAACDGSGWITRDRPEGGHEAFPCGRCNPYLREVFNDRTKWRRWLAGTPLSALGVGVELTHGRLVSDRPMPESCGQETRWDDNQMPLNYVPVNEGKRLMDEARREAARERADA